MEEYREIYLDWIKDETFNNSLTGEEGGVKLALDLLMELDPLEFFTDKEVVSEQISGHLSQTFAVNENGIPKKVMTWIKPYYRVGSVL